MFSFIHGMLISLLDRGRGTMVFVSVFGSNILNTKIYNYITIMVIRIILRVGIMRKSVRNRIIGRAFFGGCCFLTKIKYGIFIEVQV